jgi:putative tricarboxylic transport membrane protein
MVAGLGLVGAVLTNKSPVTLDQVTPLARLTGEFQPLVVAADSPIKSLADLLAQFKADPGSVSWGGFALGSPDHILSALIVQAAGGDVAKMNYIVAGAGGEMLAQVMGGHITVATGGLNEMAQQIQAGKLRALGISSPERLPGVDIPTFKEQGIDVTLVNWRGLMAPAKMRPADRKALDAALAKAVQTEEWQALLKERGWVDMYQPSEEFAAFLGTERPRIEGILKQVGLVK